MPSVRINVVNSDQERPKLDWIERERNLDLLHDEVTARLSTLATASERIETKAVVVAGFAATALQFVLTKQSQTGLWWGAAVAFALSFIAAVAAIALRRMADPPKPQELVRSYSDLRRAETLAKIVGTKISAYNRNAQANVHKAVAWWVSVVLLVGGMTLSLSNSTQGSPNEQERLVRQTLDTATAAAEAARAAADAARAAANGAARLPADPGGP